MEAVGGVVLSIVGVMIRIEHIGQPPIPPQSVAEHLILGAELAGARQRNMVWLTTRRRGRWAKRVNVMTCWI